MAEITKVTKGGEKMTRSLQPLGGLPWDGHSCDTEVYLINRTLDGL